MVDDEVTLPASPHESLIRAGADPRSEAIPRLRDALGADEPRAVVLALRGLAGRDGLTSDEWRAALAHNAVEVRREAVFLLARGALEDDVLSDQLVARLDDGDPLVVEGAAFALGERGASGAVGALIGVARDHEDPRCRESAVAALGVLGRDEALPTLIAALEDRPPVRRRAVVALANFEGPEVDAALEAARDDRDWQVRAAVAQLLDE